jgi:flagellar basal-body rod protein FlgF
MTDTVAQVSSSLGALTREFDIIAHNMANVSTAGFKRRCNSFTQALAAQGDGPAAADGGNQSQGIFDFSQGRLVQTGRRLDFALHGKGFFVVESPEGPLYTRHGVFRTNPNGQIVDGAGRLVAGLSGTLIVPQNADESQVHVSDDGRIHAGQAALGQFRIVEFPGNEDQLLPAGANCFRAPLGVEPVDAPQTVVRQGYQEASNVKIIDELVNMIMVSRLYEANTKLVSVTRDTTASLLGVAMG